MKTTLLSLLFGLLTIAACQKIELPTTSEDTEEEKNEEYQEPSGEEDESNAEEEESKDEEPKDEEVENNDDYEFLKLLPKDTVSVATALTYPIDTAVIVRGYIVGYVSGTSMKSAVFGIPPSKANTNTLLADDPNETDHTLCLPVRLPLGTSLEVRENLNLYDHPENYKRPIVIYGWVKNYLRKTGIYYIYDYKWSDEDTR